MPLRRFIVVAVHAHDTITLRSVLAPAPREAELYYRAHYGPPVTLEVYSDREWEKLNAHLLVGPRADVEPQDVNAKP